ncbi:MAG: NADH-quinone oxidoreductase subunit NuoB [Archaeoglobaceae archaeon]|nr:NADH-quinone oxidoreductase subunit NuoB [Archaeoglobaceae archaeon]MDW8118553.1 NADH-quinone oxidoreductase subunit NuoB [Archaeoglobaceae archaeon]
MDEFTKFLTSGKLAPLKKWGTKWSLWPVHLVTACCGAELAHAFASGYDGERIGALNYGIARQTNFIIVEGAITRKMARVLRITWEQMPDPKFVIVMGACGLNGGIFWNGYNLVKPSDIVPVEFFIPGCPPTPEALLRGIRQLQRKLETGEAESSIDFYDLKLQKGKIPKFLPRSPKKVSLMPSIVVNKAKDVDWAFGKELCEKFRTFKIESAVITAKNRIAVKVSEENLVEVAKGLKELGFDHVKSVNVIDLPDEGKFLVEYHVSSYSKNELMPVIVNLFTEILRKEAKISSLSEIFPSADYMEREMHDLFGVEFKGNPWKGKFLLAPDSPEFPLRKDFKLQEEVYVGD